MGAEERLADISKYLGHSVSQSFTRLKIHHIHNTHVCTLLRQDTKSSKYLERFRGFNEKDEMEAKQRVHHLTTICARSENKLDEPPLKCPNCDAMFQKIKSSHMHCVSEHPERFICCSDCFLPFRTVSHLVDHSNLQHNRLKRPNKKVIYTEKETQ